MYESIYRPCHIVWSNADPESLRKAVLSVDPAATVEDGNVGFSYPYRKEDLLYIMADFMEIPDDCSDTVREVQNILNGRGISINDIASRMRDYDGQGYIEGIYENVKGILKECLTQYLKEHPDRQDLFVYMDAKDGIGECH